jgi:hypothetical protein
MNWEEYGRKAAKVPFWHLPGQKHENHKKLQLGYLVLNLEPPEYATLSKLCCRLYKQLLRQTVITETVA